MGKLIRVWWEGLGEEIKYPLAAIAAVVVLVLVMVPLVKFFALYCRFWGL